MQHPRISRGKVHGSSLEKFIREGVRLREHILELLGFRRIPRTRRLRRTAEVARLLSPWAMRTPYSDLSSVLLEIHELCEALRQRSGEFGNFVNDVLAEARLLETDLEGAPDRRLDPIEERIIDHLTSLLGDVVARLAAISAGPIFIPDIYAVVTDEVRSAIRQAQRVLRSDAPPPWESS